MKYIFIVILTFISFASCDCFQQVGGVVLDKETKMPIKNVIIGKSLQRDFANNYTTANTSSDSTGKYQYKSISGGLFRCPPLKLYFSKEGYKTAKINFNHVSSDTILLEKSN